MRWACVDVKALPLQLLLLRHPEWRSRPVAVVEEDRPQCPILWVNERARQKRVLPGMRFASALSLTKDLCAAPVSSAEIAQSITELNERLHTHTDRVEPSNDESGVFWLNASGLELLHPSRERWAAEIRETLRRSGFQSTIVVGFTRFGTYALAKAKRQSTIVLLDSPRAEHTAVRRVPLDRLGLAPKLRDDLKKLGVTTAGDLLALPPSELFERFGPLAHRLHQLIAGDCRSPLHDRLPIEAIEEHLDLDEPEIDRERLLFIVKRLVHPLLDKIAKRGHVLNALVLRFGLEGGVRKEEQIRPAEPTLEETQLLDLVRLRLESMTIESVSSLTVIADIVRANAAQLSLFADRPRRDLAAAARAFARLVAEYGDETVVKAILRNGHLPEANYEWQPIVQLTPAHPHAHPKEPNMIRRLHERPLPLTQNPRKSRDDGWLLLGVESGPVVHIEGPFIISGGWWNKPVQREYHFIETKCGDWLWAYYDRLRRRWFLHGRIE